MPDKFILRSKFKPAGDQGQAIEKLAEGIENGEKGQILLGVTGSGKTYTVAKVIEKVNKPTLVLAHNKTLAAQLCSEFKEFDIAMVGNLEEVVIKGVDKSDFPISVRIGECHYTFD